MKMMVLLERGIGQGRDDDGDGGEIKEEGGRGGEEGLEEGESEDR